MIENARNHPNITLDVEGFELHQDDIPEKLLNSIDFWNFQDVVTKLVKFISFLFNQLHKELVYVLNGNMPSDFRIICTLLTHQENCAGCCHCTSEQKIHRGNLFFL